MGKLCKHCGQWLLRSEWGKDACGSCRRGFFLLAGIVLVSVVAIVGTILYFLP